MRRRSLIIGAAAIGTAGLAGPALLGRANGGFTPRRGEPFRPLPEIDATRDFSLEAQGGSTAFAGGAPSTTKGFGRDYLGPTLRMRRGTVPIATVRNRTDAPISSHWHGLNVPSPSDGGAHRSAIAAGGEWKATLPVEQPAATLWYHTHVHGRVATDVHAGLAGAIVVNDEESDALALPSEAGVDDLVLILQDKTFDGEGRATYDPGMMGIMHGVVGDRVLANGQLAPVATVPKGLVRLRLINASTGALIGMGWHRPARLIATDQGLLPRPIAVSSLAIGPGERAEIVVDMGQGGEEVLVARAAHASGMSGMMGGGMMGGRGRSSDAGQTLITLRTGPDEGVRDLPERLASDEASPVLDGPTRRFHLAAGMGPMNMMRRAIGSQTMTINGQPYDPERIDFTARRGTIERWRVSGAMMGHPFHAHGVKFRVLDPRRPEETGWKDSVLVKETRDLLVSIDAEARDRVPFMFHCHILEHEDAGMMGQFLTI